MGRKGPWAEAGVGSSRVLKRPCAPGGRGGMHGVTSSRCARKNFSGASRMSVNERRPVRTSERSTSALCAGSVAFGTCRSGGRKAGVGRQEYE